MKHYSSNNYVRFSKVPYPKESFKPTPIKSSTSTCPLYLFTKFEKNKLTTLDGQTIKLQIKDPKEINFLTELHLLTESLSEERNLEEVDSWKVESIRTQWLKIIQSLIHTYQLPEQQASFIQNYLDYSISDAETLAQKLKYHWDVARPIQLDDTLKTTEETPKYPSYPSSEAVIFGTIRAIMTCFFPTEQSKIDEWIDKRVAVKKQSGLHFHCDIDEGLRLGKQFGELIISSHRLTSHKYHISPLKTKKRKTNPFYTP